jgi:hypothetical protein
MKRLSFVLLAFCAAALPASAQMKIKGVETCPKPDTMQSVDVTDAPGHALMVEKGSCTWSTPIMLKGLKAVTSVNTSMAEAANMMRITEHGYDVGTMDNGDTYTAKYSGTILAAKDGSATYKGTWVFTMGTGKLKGLTGGGTYSGSAAADGSSTANIMGSYSVVKHSMKPMATPAAKPAS